MIKTRILPLLVLSSLLVSAAVADAAIAPVPTASIGSVKGSGPKGCVKRAKVVTFKLDTGDTVSGVKAASAPQLWRFVTAKVTLDGHKVVVVSFSTLGPQKFQHLINLKKYRAGAHTLRLVGNYEEVYLNRKPGHSAAIAVGKATATAKIVKCPVHKTKPTHFTG